MAYKSLRQFVEALENAGELVRVKTFVDPVLEMTEIIDRVSKSNGPAVLFENTGTDIPLLINSMGSRKRMNMALCVNDLDDIKAEIEEVFKTLTSPKDSLLDKLAMLPKLGRIASWMPKVISGKGECQQIIDLNPDLTKLPIMHCWPEDGGRYITLPVIHTKDPETGARNVGMYRVQVFGPQLTAIHWQLHKVSRKHFETYKTLGKRMPVAIALGGDPAYTYAGTAPLPENIDEYILAGFIRKKKVELVRCITQPEIEVPADSDIVIEGYVDPNEEFILEGPFGDHTGYYSLPDYYPKFHVTAITRRKDAIYPSTIVGIPPQEDGWIGKATERIFLAPIKMTMVPEIIDMDLPIEGVFHNMAIVQIHKEYPGQALKVMSSLWGAGQMMFTKMIVMVDQHTSLKDYAALARYVSENFDPMQDVVFGQGPIDVLDHSCSKMAFGGKLGIDGTRKLPEELQAEGQKPLRTREVQPNLVEVQLAHPEVLSINTSLMDTGISVCIVGVKKNLKGHIKQLSRALAQRADFAEAKIIIFLDSEVDITHVGDAFWRFCNNADVKRDGLLLEPGAEDAHGKLCLDGTRKTLELDGFQRDWPNILVSTDETIAKVDAMWDQLGLGPLIPSPSLRYKSQMYGTKAVAAAMAPVEAV
jgi:4-hydroxy-3-polyprenylbenzoate decarboxylase